MKRKICVKDEKTGKVTKGEITIRNLEHFQIQLKNRSQVFQDKRKKLPKHKNKIFEEE